MTTTLLSVAVCVFFDYKTLPMCATAIVKMEFETCAEADAEYRQWVAKNVAATPGANRSLVAIKCLKSDDTALLS